MNNELINELYAKIDNQEKIIRELQDKNKALEETIKQLYRHLNTSNMSEEEWLDYAIEYNLEQLEKRCLDE